MIALALALLATTATAPVVRTGNPNAAALPRWPRYDVATRGYLRFEQDGPAARTDLRGAVCGPRDVP